MTPPTFLGDFLGVCYGCLRPRVIYYEKLWRFCGDCFRETFLPWEPICSKCFKQNFPEDQIYFSFTRIYPLIVNFYKTWELPEELSFLKKQYENRLALKLYP